MRQATVQQRRPCAPRRDVIYLFACYMLAWSGRACWFSEFQFRSLLTDTSRACTPLDNERKKAACGSIRAGPEGAAHLDLVAHLAEGTAHFIDSDGAAVVGVDALEQQLEALQVGRVQLLGHDQQGRLLELVHGGKLAHACEHDVVDGLVGGGTVRLQPRMLQPGTCSMRQHTKQHAAHMRLTCERCSRQPAACSRRLSGTA